MPNMIRSHLFPDGGSTAKYLNHYHILDVYEGRDKCKTVKTICQRQSLASVQHLIKVGWKQIKIKRAKCKMTTIRLPYGKVLSLCK